MNPPSGVVVNVPFVCWLTNTPVSAGPLKAMSLFRNPWAAVTINGVFSAVL